MKLPVENVPDELSSELKQLLKQARDGLSPSAQTLNAVHAGVLANVVKAGGTVGSSVGAAGKSAFIAKLGIVLATVAVATAAWFWYADQTKIPAAVTNAPDVTAPPPVFGPAPVATTPPAAIALDVNGGAGQATVGVDAAVPAKVRVVRTQRNPSPPTDSLARELTLLDPVIAELRIGNLVRARSLLRLYQKEFEMRGQLAEDAGAASVEISCRSKSSDNAYLDFLETWPHSAQRTRLAGLCRP